MSLFQHLSPLATRSLMIGSSAAVFVVFWLRTFWSCFDGTSPCTCQKQGSSWACSCWRRCRWGYWFAMWSQYSTSFVPPEIYRCRLYQVWVFTSTSCFTNLLFCCGYSAPTYQTSAYVTTWTHSTASLPFIQSLGTPASYSLFLFFPFCWFHSAEERRRSCSWPSCRGLLWSEHLWAYYGFRIEAISSYIVFAFKRPRRWNWSCRLRPSLLSLDLICCCIVIEACFQS